MEVKSFLKPYVAVADMIANTFGEDCEVVVHDLEDPEHSVVYVANNKVTGREIGKSFYTLVSKVMLSEELVDDHADNYYFTAANYAAYLNYCEKYGKTSDCLITMCGHGLKSDH